MIALAKAVVVSLEAGEAASRSCARRTHWKKIFLVFPGLADKWMAYQIAQNVPNAGTESN